MRSGRRLVALGIVERRQVVEYEALTSVYGHGL